jgi:hypothetical protein
MLLRQLGVVCGFLAGAVGIAAPALAGDRALPMRFELRQEGPEADCATRCRLFISATGALSAETGTAFRTFIAGRDVTGAALVLDSDGGSVLGAMALGREVRALKLSTTVGSLVEIKGSKDTSARVAYSPQADCESMCAFVLLAGVHRSVPEEARVMVHQIWLGDRREDPTAATYSAEDLVLVQRDIGRLAKYTSDMGGPVELLDLALRIPPWEPMHALTRAELRATQLDMDGPPPSLDGGTTASLTYTPISAAPRAAASSEQGWAMIDRAGARVLARRHPLTIEGDGIGSFDIFVACGNDEGYQMTYVEERNSGDPALLAPLSSISVRMGGQSTTLKVVSSDLRGPTGTLTTVAVGTVAAPFVRTFSAPGSHSMTIGTVSPKLRTTIRIGNAGATRNLPQLASRCQAAGTVRAELPVNKTGGLAQR